jgi:acyl carrier protein
VCLLLGDYAVKHSTGLIYWCGRIDSQVKIRGMRVVLEHVESNIYTTLKQLPQYTDTLQDVKVVYDTGQYGPDTAQLICMLQLLPSSHIEDVKSKVTAIIDTVPLLRLLATALTPAEMPTAIVPYLGDVPITSSGKLDRQALFVTYKQSQQQQQQLQQERPAHTDESTDSNIHVEQPKSQQYMTTYQHICTALTAVLCNTIPNSKHLIQGWLNTSSSYNSSSDQSDTLTCVQLGITSMQAVEIAHKLRTEYSLAIDATDLLQYDLALTHLVGKIAARSNTISSGTSTAATSTQDIKPAQDDTSADNSTAAAITKKHRPDTSSSSSSSRTISNVRYNMSVGRCGRGLVSLNGEAESSVHMNNVNSPHFNSSSDNDNTLAVKLQQQWSVAFSKCVDATPLVLIHIPKGRTDTATVGSNNGLVVIASHRYVQPGHVL